MARKIVPTPTEKLVVADNNKRQAIIDRYLSSSNCTELQRDSAIEELVLRSDYNAIEDYVYNELLHIGSPAQTVIRQLKKNFNLSQLTASYVVDELLKHTCNSLNLSQEYTKTLTNIDNNIAQLNRVLESIQGTSMVDCDIDINQLFSELRQWQALKGTLINNGLNHKILQAQTVISVAKNEESIEDLQKKLSELG